MKFSLGNTNYIARAFLFISFFVSGLLMFTHFTHASGYPYNMDLDNSECIDTGDINILAANFKLIQPAAGDINNDGKVDIKDLTYLAHEYTIDTSIPPKATNCTIILPGDHLYKVNSGGLQRSYILHVPITYHGQKLPLVLNFHGGSGEANGAEIMTKMNTSSNTNNYFVAYPNGTPLTQDPTDTVYFFNPGLGEQGYLHPESNLKNVDDVAFVSAMINQMETNPSYSIDDKRIYATGLSNGAMISQHLACWLANKITAIASSEGSLWEFATSCNPSRPIPIMLFNGTGDNWLPYNGGAPICISLQLRNWKSAPSVFDIWKTKNSCTDPQPATVTLSADTTCQVYSQCAGNSSVEFCTIQDGGHTWPGGTTYIPPYPDPSCAVGNISVTNGDQAMWDFFSQFALP